MTRKIGPVIATSISLVPLTIVPWLLLHWSVPAFANPTPVGQGRWNLYNDGSSQVAKKYLDNGQSNECLPTCLQEDDLFPDRASCNHFFVCKTVSRSNGSGDITVLAAQDTANPTSDQVVLLRCSCPSEGDVYNRNLQRCSRRGHCHVSCSDPGLSSSTWESVKYNGHDCTVVPLHSTPFEAASKDHPLADPHVRANDLIMELAPVQSSTMQSVTDVHSLNGNDSSNSQYSSTPLLLSTATTDIPAISPSHTQTSLIATTVPVKSPGTVTATGPQSNCNSTLNHRPTGTSESNSSIVITNTTDTLPDTTQLQTSHNYSFITGVTHIPLTMVDDTLSPSSLQSHSFITGVTQIPTLTTESHSFITGVTQIPTLTTESHSFITGVTQIPSLTTESYSFITGVTQSPTLTAESQLASSQSYSLTSGVTQIPTLSIESQSLTSQSLSLITGVTQTPTLTTENYLQESQSYALITGVTHTSIISETQLQSSESYSFTTGVIHMSTSLVDEGNLETSQSYSFITGVTNVPSTMTAEIQPMHTIDTSSILAGATHIISEMVPSVVITPVLPFITHTLDSSTVTPSSDLLTPSYASTSPLTTMQTTDILTDINQNPEDCQPQMCLIPNTRFPNPKDCSKYYKCIMFRGQVVAKSYVCPSVMPTFSPTLKMCLRGIKCRPRCPEKGVSTTYDVLFSTTAATKTVNTQDPAAGRFTRERQNLGGW